MTETFVVIDACSSLNLLGTGRAVDLLRAMNWQLLVLPEVRQEARQLRGPLDEEGQPTWMAADWDSLEKAGLVLVQPLGHECVDALVAAAAHLTDVDAATVALAGTRGLSLLTDDAKVRKSFRSQYPHLELRASLALIRQATNHLGLPAEHVKDILQSLRWKARFAPPRHDPDRDWYLKHLSE